VLPAAATPPALVAPHPCPGASTFSCSTLIVPLDHTGTRRRTLKLAVAAATNTDAPRGVLVILAGGPGQPGAAAAPRLANRLGASVAAGYRIVMLDQRGTGATAIDCAQLQAEMGASDLYPPSAGAVRACGKQVGADRSLYGTDDVVADLELLRQALGAQRWSLDGISYGTFVAERYALAHPGRVERLVLDSVVPHTGDATLLVRTFPEVARVLRSACQNCAISPVTDLKRLVRSRRDGVKLFDALTLLSVVDPSFAGVPEALHGGGAALDRLLQRVHQAERAPAAELSQGLHAAALCGDWRFPWGDSSRPLATRNAALAVWQPRELGPFDRATAIGNGVMQQCLYWPPTAPTPPATGKLPDVPTLILAGDRDLSTPLPWALAELALAPGGKLVIVWGAGHSVQSRAQSDAGRKAVRRFLLR
jgi:pimeloyl-ACP methyl ester carboxylesterase